MLSSNSTVKDKFRENSGGGSPCLKQFHEGVGGIFIHLGAATKCILRLENMATSMHGLLAVGNVPQVYGFVMYAKSASQKKMT